MTGCFTKADIYFYVHFAIRSLSIYRIENCIEQSFYEDYNAYFVPVLVKIIRGKVPRITL
jgi:hypothetical protein